MQQYDEILSTVMQKARVRSSLFTFPRSNPRCVPLGTKLGIFYSEV